MTHPLIEETVIFLTDIEQGNWHEVEAMLAPGFAFEGPHHDPVNGHSWLVAQKALKSAFPDWKFNFSNGKVEGQIVTGSVHITATHTGELILPLPRFEPIPPKGRSIFLPIDHVQFTFNNNQIESIKIETPMQGTMMQTLTLLQS